MILSSYKSYGEQGRDRDRKHYGDMMLNKIMGRLTPLRFFIICSVVAAILIISYNIAFKPSDEIIDEEIPLAAVHFVTEGDVLKVRVSADEVTDLYGYQFRLQYDDSLFTVDGVQSLVTDIPTIFKKNFDGYVLVGATMTGEIPGYSASDTQLCELELTANTIGDISNLKLSKVNIVTSKLDYTEDVDGWTYDVTMNAPVN